MYYQRVKQLLLEININFDLETIKQISEFLQSNLGISCQEDFDYETLSASAIVSQIKTVPNISNKGFARTGIFIESIMRHIGKRSKQKYLDILTKQSMKWKEAPNWLRVKIDQVKMDYRIYKKYRKVYDGIQEFVFSKNQVSDNLMAIFWIIYIFIKNTHPQEDNASEMINLLFCIFLYLFGEIIKKPNKNKIVQLFQSVFQESKEPQNQVYKLYCLKFEQKLTEIYAYRYGSMEQINFKIFFDDVATVRFLDDISNSYDKFNQKLAQNHVDDISFLELTKNVTPMGIRNNLFDNNQQQINSKIDFDCMEDQDQFEEKQPINEIPYPIEIEDSMPLPLLVKAESSISIGPPPSPFKKSLIEDTPVKARQKNLFWVSNILGQVNQKDEEKIELVMEKYTTESYEKYKQSSNHKLQQSIKQFTPTCSNYKKRATSIYNFFLYFVTKIIDTHNQQDNELIFQNENSFNSILCLSADIFNYAYQSLRSSYRKHCQIFEISLFDGHKPLNWFGCNESIPQNLKQYLYQLQKKILIQEIWDDETGFMILTQPEDQNGYHHTAILERLKKHAKQRTQQLCSLIEMTNNEVMKIVNLMIYILEKRSNLLRKHKIDQIIVCCIASLSKINLNIRFFTLEDILLHYNKLLFSFQHNQRGLFDEQGNQIDLVQFYNETFLKNLDDILQQAENSILMTPIRLERQFRQNNGQKIPSLLETHKERKKIKLGGDSNSYRKKLWKNFQESISIESSIKQEKQSPRFGEQEVPQNINKLFSFGDKRQQKIFKEKIGNVKIDIEQSSDEIEEDENQQFKHIHKRF